jgi:hypothetical protein
VFAKSGNSIDAFSPQIFSEKKMRNNVQMAKIQLQTLDFLRSRYSHPAGSRIGEMLSASRTKPDAPRNRLHCSADTVDEDAQAEGLRRVMQIGERVALSLADHRPRNHALTSNLLILRKTHPDVIGAAQTVLARIGPVGRLSDTELAAKIKSVLLKP